jgi:SlyX protein
MTERRLEELESRLAFQDETIETLNRELLALRAELAVLKEQVARLSDRARGQDQPAVGDAADEPPPPHY